eukprot:8208731-Ditylum_brightwellii.AAC.1
MECQLQMHWMHYKFNKLTGCAWINQKTDWHMRNRNRAIEKNGQRRRRLDFTLLHLPIVPQGSNRNIEPKSCQLHLWAAHEEVQGKAKPAGFRKGVVHCKYCN